MSQFFSVVAENGTQSLLFCHNMNIQLKHKIFHQISNIADQMQLETYVIGGYVRDLYLKRSSKDIDIVTVGSGIELDSKVAKQLKPSPRVNFFKNFGTAMLKYKDLEIEFVGARKESYKRDSRKPIVEDGTLEDDIFIWENESGEITAVLNREAPGSVFLQIHPDFRDSELMVEMLSIAEKHLSVPTKSGYRHLHVWADKEGEQLQAVLSSCDYAIDHGRKPEYLRRRILTKQLDPLPTADGYTIRESASYGSAMY